MSTCTISNWLHLHSTRYHIFRMPKFVLVLNLDPKTSLRVFFRHCTYILYTLYTVYNIPNIAKYSQATTYSINHKPLWKQVHLHRYHSWTPWNWRKLVIWHKNQHLGIPNFFLSRTLGVSHLHEIFKRKYFAPEDAILSRGGIYLKKN